MRVDRFISLIGNEPILLGLILFFLLVCLIGVAAYFLVKRPKKGTLEWIGLLRVQEFRPLNIAPLFWKDLIWLLALAALSTLLQLVRIICFLELYKNPVPIQIFLQAALQSLFPVLLLSTALFVFFRMLFPQPLTAILLALLGTLTCSSEVQLTIVLLASFIFLYLWLCGSTQTRVRFHGIWLLLSGMFYGIVLLGRWAAIYLIPIYIAAYVMGKVYQWHAVDVEKRKIKLFASFSMLFFALVLGGLALWLVYYIYTHDNIPFWKVLTSAETYRELFPTVLQKLGDISVYHEIELTILAGDVFLFLLGFFCWIPTVYTALKERQSIALLCSCCMIPFLLMWIFGGVYLMLPALLLPIGWVLSTYIQRGRQRLAISISMTVLFCFFAELLLR